MSVDRRFRNQAPRADAWAGGESAWVGSSPTAGARKVRKEFTAAVTSDAGGIASTAYPGGAFPNGIMSVVVTAGDTAANLGFCMVQLSAQSLSTLNFWPRTNLGAAIASAAVRVNVVAVGW